MTHSLYRQGDYADLIDDYVVVASALKGFPDLPSAIKKFQDIGSRYQPVNHPAPRSLRHLVYDNQEKVSVALKDLAATGLGFSVTVSGLNDRVRQCCYQAGLKPHTLNQSLGVWGCTERLPPASILSITTMCGHGRISPALVQDLAAQVNSSAISLEAAVNTMGRLCICNIFNRKRAARLMQKLVSATTTEAQPDTPPAITPRKDSGITIDEKKCVNCGDCRPYCPMSAIVPADGSYAIDAGRCTECGICWQARVCPVDAIVARELAWPRTLRGKFQSSYAPYREAPVVSSRVKPVPREDEVHTYMAFHHPNELVNDVTGSLKPGNVCFVVELGRPHLGTTFRDAQKVIQALLPFGLNLSEQYPPIDERRPLSDLAEDAARGILRQDILEQKTNWVLLKLTVSEGAIPAVLRVLGQVEKEIETVFSLGVISLAGQDGLTVMDSLKSVRLAPNGKTNVGLGRPPVNLP